MRSCGFVKTQFDGLVIAPPILSAGGDTPTHGTDAPTHGTDAPTHGTDAPTHGTDAPTHGTDADADANHFCYIFSVSLSVKSTIYIIKPGNLQGNGENERGWVAPWQWVTLGIIYILCILIALEKLF